MPRRFLVAIFLMAFIAGVAQAVPIDPPSEGSVASAGGCTPSLPDVFQSQGVALLDHLSLADFPGSQTRGSDVWGYTSPSGRRYVLAMFTKGTAFVEVTDPNNVTIIDYVDGEGIDQVWRDAKTYQNYAYVVTDGSGVGLQIIDLSDIDNGTVTHVNTTDLGSSFSMAHNIAINETSGFAYMVGGNLASGGLVAVDLSNPTAPTVAGAWDDNYIHDVEVVSYTSGPYAGQEIAFAYCGGAGFFVVDATNKANIFTRTSLSYPNLGYCHQGWLTEDRRYAVMDDELDEFFGNVPTTTTYMIDVQDLDSVSIATSFTTGLPSSDHNLFVRGDYAYCANYSSGLHIWDIGDVNNVQNAGFFDTFPEHDNPGFCGAWAPYVGFPGTLVMVNDRERGLFILDAAEAVSGGVPAVSTWGAVLLALSVGVAGTVVFRRLRIPVAAS